MSPMAFGILTAFEYFGCIDVVYFLEQQGLSKKGPWPTPFKNFNTTWYGTA